MGWAFGVGGKYVLGSCLSCGKGTGREYIEKLRYIHRNPVKRGLVESPELWRWSSYRDYWLGERGKVKIGN